MIMSSGLIIFLNSILLPIHRFQAEPGKNSSSKHVPNTKRKCAKCSATCRKNQPPCASAKHLRRWRKLNRGKNVSCIFGANKVNPSAFGMANESHYTVLHLYIVAFK
uniref:Putative secreted protein n=1 Tax=Anopheles triannulatus TaxID=58253 RepID=A0A2M4B1U1_9DIPT